MGPAAAAHEVQAPVGARPHRCPLGTQHLSCTSKASALLLQPHLTETSHFIQRYPNSPTWHVRKIPTIFLCPQLMRKEFFQRNPQDPALQRCQPGVSPPGFYSSCLKRSISHFAFKSAIIGPKTMLVYAFLKKKPSEDDLRWGAKWLWEFALRWNESKHYCHDLGCFGCLSSIYWHWYDQTPSSEWLL